MKIWLLDAAKRKTPPCCTQGHNSGFRRQSSLFLDGRCSVRQVLFIGCRDLGASCQTAHGPPLIATSRKGRLLNWKRERARVICHAVLNEPFFKLNAMLLPHTQEALENASASGNHILNCKAPQNTTVDKKRGKLGTYLPWAAV